MSKTKIKSRGIDKVFLFSVDDDDDVVVVVVVLLLLLMMIKLSLIIKLLLEWFSLGLPPGDVVVDHDLDILRCVKD
jgi:hypothetical protein